MNKLTIDTIKLLRDNKYIQLTFLILISMKRLFHFLINCFLPKGRRNHKSMAKQSTHNFTAMKANIAIPEIAVLVGKTEPTYIKYHNLLTTWVMSKAYKSGSAQGFNDYLKTLREKLEEWELVIRQKFKNKSVEYKTIFPAGRSFILDGTQEQVIMKFNAFRGVVESFADLSSIYIDIKDISIELEKLYGVKNEKFSLKSASTSELDEAHDEMGKALYYNLLQLTSIFIDKTERVEDYFDMTLLRAPQKTEVAEESSLVITIPAASSVDSGFVFTILDKYLLINKCAHTLQFYGASTPTELPKTTPRELIPGEEIEITGLEMGAPANRYLIFINPSTTATGEVEILEVD